MYLIQTNTTHHQTILQDNKIPDNQKSDHRIEVIDRPGQFADNDFSDEQVDIMLSKIYEENLLSMYKNNDEHINHIESEVGGVTSEPTAGCLWSGKRTCWLIMVLISAVFFGANSGYLIMLYFKKDTFLSEIKEDYKKTAQEAQKIWEIVAGIALGTEVLFVALSILAVIYHEKAKKEIISKNNEHLFMQK